MEIISRIHLPEPVAPRGGANEFCALLSPADYQYYRELAIILGNPDAAVPA